MIKMSTVMPPNGSNPIGFMATEQTYSFPSFFSRWKYFKLLKPIEKLQLANASLGRAPGLFVAAGAAISQKARTMEARSCLRGLA
jgi:hypothetical protein